MNLTDSPHAKTGYTELIQMGVRIEEMKQDIKDMQKELHDISVSMKISSEAMKETAAVLKNGLIAKIVDNQKKELNLLFYKLLGSGVILTVFLTVLKIVLQ